MIKEINKVAVLGTGVMGAQIAAHLTNVKIPVYSFDINQEVSESGIVSCQKLKPNPFYNPKTSDLITCYNYDEHLEKLSIKFHRRSIYIIIWKVMSFLIINPRIAISNIRFSYRIAVIERIGIYNSIIRLFFNRLFFPNAMKKYNLSDIM